MANYDLREARRLYDDMVNEGRSIENLGNGDIDYGRIDMLGNFLWQAISEEERTKDSKQRVIFACLLAAYVSGIKSVDEKEIATAFFEFVKGMEIPSVVSSFDDLMGWE